MVGRGDSREIREGEGERWWGVEISRDMREGGRGGEREVVGEGGRGRETREGEGERWWVVKGKERERDEGGRGREVVGC